MQSEFGFTCEFAAANLSICCCNPLKTETIVLALSVLAPGDRLVNQRSLQLRSKVFYPNGTIEYPVYSTCLSRFFGVAGLYQIATLLAKPYFEMVWG